MNQEQIFSFLYCAINSTLHKYLISCCFFFALINAANFQNVIDCLNNVFVTINSLIIILFNFSISGFFCFRMLIKNLSFAPKL